MEASSLKTSEPQIVTFGCRLNNYESEVMRDHARSQGLDNAIIVNTCAVTAEAERQARQSIRRLRRENPSALIIVTGCSVQTSPQLYTHMPEVDRILGNHEKMQKEWFSPHLPERIHVTDIMTVRETASHLISGFENHVRAFIQIQNGCDHRCTFCTIPFGRGNNRSVPMGEIAQQINLLREKGCQEIVFTGVDITGYGSDLPGKPTLAQMSRRILALFPDLPRLRFSSLDPVEVDSNLLDLIASNPRIMPHFHLSLQAGDDLILKRMKRRHLRHHAIELCKSLQDMRPEGVRSADIIAGFPTETEEMFENTLRLVEECGLSQLHVFPYSPRPGTPAARMPQLPSSVIKERARRLRQVGKEKTLEHLRQCVGKIFSVLVERHGKGHTQCFTPVVFNTPEMESSLGHIISVTAIGIEETRLIVKKDG